MVRIFPYAAVKFMAFEQYSKRINKRTAFWQFATGSMAGLTAVFVTYPLELIRVRLAFSQKRQSILKTLVQITEKQKFKSLFRGFMPTVYGIIPYSGISFLVYEQLKQILPVNDLGTLLSGAVAGLCSQTISYPFEIIRRNIQVEKSTTTKETIQMVLKQSGLRGFYVGLSIGYLKVIPMTMLSYWTYEFCNKSKWK